jgi:hypothetical protein
MKFRFVFLLGTLLAGACAQEPDYELTTTESRLTDAVEDLRYFAEEVIFASPQERKEIMCSVLDDVLNTEFVQRADSFLSRPAFFISGSLGAGVFDSNIGGGYGGADLVFDLWEHEISMYTYVGHQTSLRIGGEGSLAVGFASGLNEGLEGWEGDFQGYSGGPAGIDPFPFVQVGGSVGGFYGLDGSHIVGFYGQVSVGIDITEVIPGAKSVNLSEQFATWTMWEDANRAILANPLRRFMGIESAYTSRGKEYVRFKKGKPFLIPRAIWPSWGHHTGSGIRMGALIAVSTIGAVGPGAIALGEFPVLLGVLRDLGYSSPADTVAQLCR